MRYDIISMGSAVIDAFLETELPEKRNFMELKVGSKILVNELYFDTGGGGTNTAVAFSRLGLKTGFLGKLGKDANAEKILEELEKEKVDFLGSFSDEPTGYSVIIDSKKKNRTVLTYKGANSQIKFSEIDLKNLDARWFYFSTATGESFKTQEKLIEFVHKKGIHTAYNPSSYVTRHGAKYLRNILNYTEILILNLEEAMHLVKEGDLFVGLHKLGPKIVAITNGEKGSSVSDGEKIYVVPGRKVKVKEVTGAGDAYAAGFVFGFIKYGNIEEAIKCAVLNAESAIEIPGAKGGMLTYEELIERLTKKHVKIKISHLEKKFIEKEEEL